MAGVGLVSFGVDLSLDDKLVVIEIAAVSRYAEVIAHILRAQTLLAGHQGLVQLLTVAGTDDLGTGVAEELLYGFREHSYSRRVGLLDE